MLVSYQQMPSQVDPVVKIELNVLQIEKSISEGDISNGSFGIVSEST